VIGPRPGQRMGDANKRADYKKKNCRTNYGSRHGEKNSRNITVRSAEDANGVLRRASRPKAMRYYKK